MVSKIVQSPPITGDADVLVSTVPPLPKLQGRKMDMCLPSNLLDDLTDESGALAQVALGPGDTSLGDTRSGLLYPLEKIDVSVHRLRSFLVSRAKESAEILHEVRL